ncbi:flippase [Brevundimonas sp.]|uniref:flippase n=1 Tax=Brevundimonas sp. TaxID=1871086 RepID=UPI0025C25739|nr:flippase [Brevundimonas sp.]
MSDAASGRLSRLTALIAGNGLRARLLRGGMGSLMVRVTSMGLTLLLAMVLARALGAEGYGTYAYVFALVSLLATPAQLGLPTLVVRETAKAEAVGDLGLIRGVWRWSGRLAAGLSLSLALTGGLAALVFVGRIPANDMATWAWGLVLVPVIAAANLKGAALQGLGRVVLGQLQEFILRPGLHIALVLAALLLAGSLSPARAMSLHVAAALVGLIVTLWLLRRARPQGLSASPIDTTQKPRWLATTLPLAALAGMQTINLHLGVLMMGPLATVEDVGVYRIVMQGGTLLAFGGHAIALAVAPTLARLHALGETRRLQKVAALCSAAVTILTVPIAIVFVVWGDRVLGLAFGSEFARGHTALAIVAVGRVVHAAFGSVSTLLTMTGHEREASRGLAISVVANAVLNLALIPSYGLAGAAVASVLTLMIWNLLLWRDARRLVGVDSSLFGLIALRTRNQT